MPDQLVRTSPGPEIGGGLRLDLSRIAQDLQIRKVQVEAVVQLLDEGNTIPFITRYRKERTGGLDEEVIRQIQAEHILGDPFVIKAQRHSTPVKPEAEQARPAWYKDVKRSGDLIVENAVHNLDVCNWVAASRPESAFGHGKKYFPKPMPAGTWMMDGFSVEYVYENDMHLDYSQLYLHPRSLKELANGQWYMIFGEKGAVNLEKGSFYQDGADEVKQLITLEVRDAGEDAMTQFYRAIRENRKPVADVTVAATAALTAIMGREAIYRRRMVTWKELGVTV